MAHAGFTGLVAVLLLSCALATPALAAKQKYGDSANASDALFDPNRVIQIEIRLDPKDWHALRISHPELRTNEYGGLVPIAMNYEYYRADVVIDGKPVKSVGVRKKSTWGSTARPSFKIKLDEYVKGQEFSGLEMLTLNNLRFDPTRAQQSMVYSFMNKAGAISPRANLARVTVNGEDLGVYGHVESIDKRFIKRHFGNAKGDLYEGWYGAEFTTNAYTKLTHKWGRDDDLTQVRKLTELMETPGPIPLTRIDEMVDLNSFITFWSSTVLVGNTDCYPSQPNNYFGYREPVSGKFFMIPWGADAWAFFPGRTETRGPKSVWVGGYLCYRLWEIPEVRVRYQKEMRRLLADVWDEKGLLAELNQARRLYGEVQPENASEGNAAAERITQFIQGRRDPVLAELGVPAKPWPAPPLHQRLAALQKPNQKPNGPAMVIEGSFSAVIAEAFPTNVAGYFGRGTAALQSTVADKTRQPFARIGAVAVPRKKFEEDNRIQIVATSDTNELSWRISFRLDAYRAPLVPSTLEIGGNWTVRASVEQDSPISQSRGGNQGTLELTQTSTNLGGTISGKFKINTTAFDEEKKP